MGGGLIQLQTYGAANQYLMGNPQITFWKVVYKRHTNFSMEHIEVPFDKLQELSYGSTTKLRSKVPRHADLISKMYLSFIIPGIKSSSTYSVRLIQNFASSLIVSANLYIGGQSIEKIYGEWIHIYHNLFMNEDKRKMYEDMTGNSKIDSDVTSSYPTVTISGSEITDYYDWGSTISAKHSAYFASNSSKYPDVEIDSGYLTTGLHLPFRCWVPLNFWFTKN